MGHPQLAAFSRLAKEDTPPTRVLAGQATKLARTAHDIRYDPVHDEILIANPQASAILTFRGDANGAEPPIRIIEGPKAQFGRSLDRLDVDPVHNEIFQPAGDKILVFSREADGDVSPIRIIQGPDTRLRRSIALTVDPVHNLIVVGSVVGEGQDTRVDLLLFNRTDSGNVKPRAVIRGPRTGPPMTFEHLFGQMQVYPPKGWIIVTLPGRYQSWESSDYTPFIGIWSINDNGDVPPRWKLGGPKSNLKRPRGVVLIPKSKEIAVADMHLNAILTYYFPELF